MSVSFQHLLLSIIFALLFAAWSSYLAKHRGRDPRVWFVLGFCFGLFGLLVLLVLPNLAKNSDSDNAIKEMTILPKPVIDKEDVNDLEEWYYLDSKHQQHGPVKLADLKGLLFEKKLLPSTYVWKEGMEEWETIEECGLL